MANQTSPIRPWFRLGSIPAPPAPTPAAQQRPLLQSRPTFRAIATIQPQPTQPSEPPESQEPPSPVLPAPTVSSARSSPQAKISAPLSSVQTSIPRAFPFSNSVPALPVQRTAEASQNLENSAYPKTVWPAVKTPPQSPKVKATAPPPSHPLTLPPSELKFREETVPKFPIEEEQKVVLVQKTIEKPKSLYNSNGGDFMRSSSEVRKSAILRNRKVSDSEDCIARIVTLAGENKGAVMELTQSPKKHGFGSSPKNLRNNGNSTIRTVGGRWERNGSSSSNEDDNVKKKDKSHEGRTKASPPLTAHMNSNVQGVNNSIMYGAECKHNDPGIHLNLSRKPF